MTSFARILDHLSSVGFPLLERCIPKTYHLGNLLAKLDLCSCASFALTDVAAFSRPRSRPLHNLADRRCR
jgi:hypothetical protein